MDINLLNQNNISSDFINKFLEELKRFMEEKDLNLTSEEQRIYSREEFKIYENLEDEYFVVHRKYYEDDRIKIEQCKNNQSRLTIIKKDDIENEDIREGDILKKEGDKYILDKEKTKEIKEQLLEIKKQIVNNRKQMS